MQPYFFTSSQKLRWLFHKKLKSQLNQSGLVLQGVKESYKHIMTTVGCVNRESMLCLLLTKKISAKSGVIQSLTKETLGGLRKSIFQMAKCQATSTTFQ